MLELGEYRESEDLDFMCSAREGYRALRSTITNISLGSLLAVPLPLAREVRADRYGIRTFLEVEGGILKIEVVSEGRVTLGGEAIPGIPVPCLDKVSCYAQKFLANADRGADQAMLGRDVVDLAFMLEGWGDALARQGMAVAREAYGDVVLRASKEVAVALLGDRGRLRRCVAALKVTGQKTLLAGLARLAKGEWIAERSKRRPRG